MKPNVNHDRLLQLFAVLALVGMIGASPATAVAAQYAQTPDVSNLLVPGDVSVFVDPELSQTTGPIQVVVQLTTAPLAVAYGVNAKQLGGKLSPSQERDYLHQLAKSQDTVMSQIRSLGGQELGRLSKVLDALIINIDSSQVNALASLPNVASIRPVQTYQIELSDVVPYIGATAVHNLGFDGTGVRVAVLDSGIDYTHADLGGPGTAAAYTAAYGISVGDSRNRNTDGLFPTAKVIGGYDFVGERWPGPDPACGVDSHNNPLVCLRPDPDPIDCGPSTIPPPCAGGHGTHTSSIIGGAGSVAPGVSLYAVKVCSAV
ncbi:MAG TPA: S8 family serine peptidase, partial [Candidatus Bathyarchaeia archaeon]